MSTVFPLAAVRAALARNAPQAPPQTVPQLLTPFLPGRLEPVAPPAVAPVDYPLAAARLDARLGEPARQAATPIAGFAPAPGAPLAAARLDTQPAPVGTPVAPVDFVTPHLRAGARSADAGVRRAALESLGVPGELQDLMNAGDPAPVMPDHAKDKPRGFWGSLKHYLEHIGKGAVAGAAAGGPFGMIAGAIGGGASPEFADRLVHNTINVPMWQQRNAYAQQLADQRIGRIGRIADFTGVSPFTGELTPDEQFRREQLDATREYRRSLAEERALRSQQRAEAEDRQALEDWARQHPGTPYPASIVKTERYRAWIGTTSQPPKAQRDPNPILKEGPGGVLYQLNRETNLFEPAFTALGQPMQVESFEARNYARSVAKDAEAAEKERRAEERALARRYKDARDDAIKLDEDIKKMEASLKVAKPEEQAALQSLLDTRIAHSRSAWEEVLGYVLQLRDEFGWEAHGLNIEKEYPSAKPPAGRPAQSAPAARPAAPQAKAKKAAKVASAAYLREFADAKFGGDVEKAKQWFKDNGYRVE